MATSIDEAKLKDLLKSAVAEVLEERREFVKEIIEEAIEDVALARAMDEGVNTDAVSRKQVFRILETAGREPSAVAPDARGSFGRYIS